MCHACMELYFGLIRQFGCAFLQYAECASMISLLKENPTERISKMRLVRRRFPRSLSQIKSPIELSELLGIYNREIVQRYGRVWRAREEFVISIARCRKILHAFVNRSK